MTAAEIHRHARAAGGARIVAHCRALGLGAGDAALSAQARLETVLGPELAQRLVHALSGDHRGRVQRF
jgi:hypothetical protein